MQWSKRRQTSGQRQRVDCRPIAGPHSVPKALHQTSGALDPAVAAFWGVIIRTKYTGDPSWR